MIELAHTYFLPSPTQERVLILLVNIKANWARVGVKVEGDGAWMTLIF